MSYGRNPERNLALNRLLLLFPPRPLPPRPPRPLPLLIALPFPLAVFWFALPAFWLLLFVLPPAFWLFPLPLFAI